MPLYTGCQDATFVGLARDPRKSQNSSGHCVNSNAAPLQPGQPCTMQQVQKYSTLVYLGAQQWLQQGDWADQKIGRSGYQQPD